MKLLAAVAALVATFVLLVRLMPAQWALPLYVIFLLLTVGLTAWERRRIAARRRQLERELHKERLGFGRLRREMSDPQNGDQSRL